MIELNNKLINVYRGSNKVSRVFLGSSLIYPTEFAFEDNLLVWLDGRDYLGSPATWSNRATNGASVTIGMNGAPYGSGLKVLFDGVSQYGIFPSVFSDPMNFSNTTIIKFKLKSSLSATKGIFGLTGAGDYNRCQLYHDKVGKFAIILGAKTAMLSEPPEVDKWYTVAWRGSVKGNDAIDYFVNGAWYKGDTPNATSAYSAKQFLIGAYGAQDALGILAKSYSNIEFASAYVYDRLLSNKEVEDIYNYENTIDRDSRIKYDLQYNDTPVYYDSEKDVYKFQMNRTAGYKWISVDLATEPNQEFIFETDVYGVQEYFSYLFDKSVNSFPYTNIIPAEVEVDLPYLKTVKFNYIPRENEVDYKSLLFYLNSGIAIPTPPEARVFLQGLKSYKYEGETNHFNIRKVQGVAGFGLNVNIFTGSFESIKNGSAKGTASTTDLINMENNIMYNVDIKIEPISRNFGLYLWAKNDLSMRNFIFTGNKLLNTQGNFNTNCKFLNVINEPMQFASYFLSNSTVGNVCIISKLRISTIQNYFNITNVNEKSNVDILNDIENNKVTLTKNAEGQFGNVKYNIPNLKDNTKYYVFVDNLNNIGNVYIEASQGFKSKERIKLNEAIPTNTDENMPSLQAEVPTGTKYELDFVKEPSKTYKLVLETTENSPIGTVSEFNKMYIWTDNEIVYTIPQDGLIGKYELSSFVDNTNIWNNMISDTYHITFNINQTIDNNMVMITNPTYGELKPVPITSNNQPFTIIIAYYPIVETAKTTGLIGQLTTSGAFNRYGLYLAQPNNDLAVMTNMQPQGTGENVNIYELNISAYSMGIVGENVSILHNGNYKDLYIKEANDLRTAVQFLIGEVDYIATDTPYKGGIHSIYLYNRKLNEIELRQVNDYIKKNSENVLPLIPFNYVNGYQNMRVNQTYDNNKGIVKLECTGAGTYNYGGIGLTELDFGTYEIHFNVYANNGYNTYFNPGSIRTTAPVIADITIDVPFIERKILTFTIDETNKGLLKLLFYYGDIPASSSVPGDLIYVDDIVIYKKG